MAGEVFAEKGFGFSLLCAEEKTDASCDNAIDTERKSLHSIAIMQQLMTVEQIISRAEAIRLPRNVLVKEARVANSTVLRAMVNGGGKVKTLQALAAVVVSHELRMLAYLAALHPKEAADGL